MSRISAKNQITLPVEQLRRLGWKSGDEVVVEPWGEDKLVLRRRKLDRRSALGVFDGLYEADYLENLRSGDWT